VPRAAAVASDMECVAECIVHNHYFPEFNLLFFIFSVTKLLNRPKATAS